MKALLFLVALLPACMPSADKYTYACKGDGECGEGWVCAEGLCADGSTLPACADQRTRCAGICCGADQECVTSAKGVDQCCVPGGKGVRCKNGEDLYLFDSCGNPGDEPVEDCGASGCSLQTNLCLTCEPTCDMQDGTPKECGNDSCDQPTCGDCGGVEANGVCTDYVCNCGANARCGQSPAIVCCAPGELCLEGVCTPN